jgi:hypothetical protein
VDDPDLDRAPDARPTSRVRHAVVTLERHDHSESKVSLRDQEIVELEDSHPLKRRVWEVFSSERCAQFRTIAVFVCEASGSWIVVLQDETGAHSLLVLEPHEQTVDGLSAELARRTRAATQSLDRSPIAVAG